MMPTIHKTRDVGLELKLMYGTRKRGADGKGMGLAQFDNQAILILSMLLIVPS